MVGGQEIHRRVADEAADEIGGGVAVDLDRRGRLHDAALVHHRDAVGEAHRLDLIVGDVDGGGAALLQHALQLGAHLQPQQRVEVGERLVHQQHLGLHGQRPGHGDALALAAGKLAGIAVEQLLDMHQAAERLTLVSTSACGSFFMRRPKAMFSNTVRCGKTA